MKKYNLFSLYVIGVEYGIDIHYLICKYNKLSNTYTEIFTNEKIKVMDGSMIKSLSSYYLSGEPLLLDKKELLRKYLIINGEACLEKYESLFLGGSTTTSLNDILEKATSLFFPKEGVWDNHCFSQPQNLEMSNLPCHLRDDLWLAKMLKQNQKLYNISINSVLQFIKTSSFFQEKRHEYEQKIVKWQIDWMKSGNENWIIDEDYGGDFVFLTSVCDLGFRKGIVDTLSRIGMNIDAIEEGIEKNADIWRDTLMCKAFCNEYELVFLNIDCSNFLEEEGQLKQERKDLESVDLEFKEKWLKLRKYEYYQRHKDSVDKYGTLEPDMILTKEEVAEIKTYLKQKHNEKMMQIKQYAKEKQGQSRILKKLN